MTEHTCSTCRWWVTPRYPTRPQRYAVNRECSLAATGYEDVPLHPESKFHATMTDDAHGASLITHPDFGCNQWEEKE